MATQGPIPEILDPMIDPRTGEYAVIAPGHTFKSVTQKIAGIVLRPTRRSHGSADFPRRDYRYRRTHRGDLALPQGRRHLGRHHSRRVGLRHHQLRLVDRYRPRRHADLRDSPALQAAVAQLHQPLCRGHDHLRRLLRGHLPAAAHRPSVAGVLAAAVSELDERLAAVPQPAGSGTSSRSPRTLPSRCFSGTSA